VNSRQSCRGGLAIFAAAILAVFAAGPTGSAQDDRKLVESARNALRSDKVDRQRAALVLIPELNLKGEPAEQVSQLIEAYLKKTNDEEGQVLALRAYGKLTPQAGPATVVFTNHLKSPSAAVRRAVGLALVDLSTAMADALGSPVLGITGSNEGAAMAAGGGISFAIVRAQVETAIDDDDGVRMEAFAENTPRLLPVCALALADEDDQVKAAGAEAIARISQAVARVLPDTSLMATDSRPAPSEMKVKWVLLAPVLDALSKAVPNLDRAMTAATPDARKSGTRAAEAVTQARSGALANQRLKVSFFESVLDKPTPNSDVLGPSVQKLLPALAERLEDNSADVRLVAIEGFEHVGPDARSQIAPIARASAHSDIFVRWVATRTLGKMLPGSPRPDAEQLVDAIAARVGDTDIDVRNAALSALDKARRF